jgi:putative Holliday junction resolvase
MRCIGIDLGDKRTGLAVGDTLSLQALPLCVIDVPLTQRDGDSLLETLCQHISGVVSERESCTLVFGLPLNMDGSEGPRATLVRAFAQRLVPRVRHPIVFHDERLTSADADWKLARSGLTHAQKKARRDALAATAMLADYLRSQPESSPHAGE